MNEPAPSSQPNVPSGGLDSDARMLAYLALQQEMQELHARLQYLRLLLKMGVGSR